MELYISILVFLFPWFFQSFTAFGVLHVGLDLYIYVYAQSRWLSRLCYTQLHTSAEFLSEKIPAPQTCLRWKSDSFILFNSAYLVLSDSRLNIPVLKRVPFVEIFATVSHRTHKMPLTTRVPCLPPQPASVTCFWCNLTCLEWLYQGRLPYVKLSYTCYLIHLQPLCEIHL